METKMREEQKLIDLGDATELTQGFEADDEESTGEVDLRD